MASFMRNVCISTDSVHIKISRIYTLSFAQAIFEAVDIHKIYKSRNAGLLMLCFTLRQISQCQTPG